MDFEPGVESALMQVLALGKLDGVEHLMIVRDGEVVYTNKGDDKTVRYDEFKDSKPGDVLVHNHPDSLNALSNGDIAQLFTSRELGAIYAIADDGSIYRASNRDKGMEVVDFMFAWDVARDMLTNKPEVEAVAHRLGLENSELNEAHWVNRMLAEHGVFDYQYVLGDKTRRMVNAMDRGIGFEQMNKDYYSAGPMSAAWMFVMRGM